MTKQDLVLAVRLLLSMIMLPEGVFSGSLYILGRVVALGYRGHYQRAFRGLLLALAREAPALLHTQ
jgi:hypothetical protein